MFLVLDSCHHASDVELRQVYAGPREPSLNHRVNVRPGQASSGLELWVFRRREEASCALPKTAFKERSEALSARVMTACAGVPAC